jgi:uncharacterized hydrophobic protein (TIGR00271 family)
LARSPEEVAALDDKLRSDARMDRAYLALLIVASIVASLGLEQNSAATIIGAMVVAPLMLPIRALGFGLLRMDGRVLTSSILTLCASAAIIIAVGALVGRLADRPELSAEIVSRTSVTFLGLAVAIAGGVLAGLSRTEWDSKITDSLIGVGIAVSLVPPLCTVGITLAYGAYYESFGALMIFLTNMVGISFACMVAFWATGYGAEALWKPVAALGVFAIAIGLLSPELAQTGRRARTTSHIESFLNDRITTYLPSAIKVESVQISWKEQPREVVAVVRSERAPTRAQVGALNEALNRSIGEPLRITIEQDPAASVSP